LAILSVGRHQNRHMRRQKFAVRHIWQHVRDELPRECRLAEIARIDAVESRAGPMLLTCEPSDRRTSAQPVLLA